jgi:AraC-like DNA-binding protein
MLQTIEVITDDLAELSAVQKVRRVHERLEGVVGSLCDMYAKGEVRGAGRLRLSASPDIVVGVMSGMSITCERTAAHIARHDDDALFVQMNLGTARIIGRQMGRDYVLAPGAATVSVHNASLRFDVEQGATLLGITLPRRWTDGWGVLPEDLAGRPVDAQASALRFLAPYAQLLCDQPLPDAGFAAASAAHLAYLIGVGFGAADTRDEGLAGVAGETRLNLVRRIMRRDCRSEELTAARVGAELGISERMVQHVLQGAGTTFSQVLGEYRCERAKALLMDPAFDGVSVANIGFACGFSDVSAFYRAFRRRFDASPGDVRAGRGEV